VCGIPAVVLRGEDDVCAGDDHCPRDESSHIAGGAEGGAKERALGASCGHLLVQEDVDLQRLGGETVEELRLHVSQRLGIVVHRLNRFTADTVRIQDFGKEAR
jgi:hypothetical protein